MSLFQQVSTNSLKKISSTAKKHKYKKGSTIFNGHSHELPFLIVTQGSVKIFKESAEGEEIIVDILASWQYYGEQFVFNISDNEIYTGIALSDLSLITLPLSLLKQLVIGDHQLAINFLKTSFEKKEQLEMEVEHLAIQNAAQRLGCLLLRTCKLATGKGITFPLPYDKSLLATRLGMRAETLSRALSKLNRNCALSITGQEIGIPDIEELSRYVCQHCSKLFPCKDITGIKKQS